MRKSAMLMAVALLLGGCAILTPPPEAPREPVAARPAPQPRAPQVRAPQRAGPRRAQPIRIDNTSIESFRASYERLHASLSPAQRADLNDVVAQLTFEDYGGAADMPGNLRSSAIVPEMIRHRIAGLTYAEIIALSR
jgi:hypothetical protein